MVTQNPPVPSVSSNRVVLSISISGTAAVIGAWFGGDAATGTPHGRARVAIQAIRWSLDGERANDDDRDAVFDTASVVPYRISAKHLVTLYWISPISKWVDYQHSALPALTRTTPPFLLTFLKPSTTSTQHYQHS